MKHWNKVLLMSAAMLFLAGGTLRAAEVDNAKLDQILENQKQILSELAEVKEELKVIKVRVTINS